MHDHQALVMTITAPVSKKARASVLNWANGWQVRQSEALRAIFLRGLAAAARRPALPDYPNTYEARCAFRVTPFMLEMSNALLQRHPGWEPSHIYRAVLYLGLLEVQQDGQMQLAPEPPKPKNREVATSLYSQSRLFAEV